MILDHFEEWKKTYSEDTCAHSDADTFRFFYASDFCKNKSEHEILCQLSYEIYCIQVCMEGFLIDMECISEEIYEHRKQESKQPRLQELRGRLCRMERYGNSAV
jgi:hypothetical protein